MKNSELKTLIIVSLICNLAVLIFDSREIIGYTPEVASITALIISLRIINKNKSE